MKIITRALLVLFVTALPYATRGQYIAGAPGPGYSEDTETFMHVSTETAHLRIREQTKYAQFISDDDAVFRVNWAISRGNWAKANNILKRYSVNRMAPPDLATLLATNDTLPRPKALASSRSAANRASWGQIGLFYGVQLIGKGSGSSGGSTSMTYLEPLAYVTYSYVLPDNKGRVFAGLGPYIALGLWGKISSGNYSANTFDSQSGYSRFDAGLYLTAGYQHPLGLRLSIANEVGLVNIRKNNPNEEVYNRVWSLNVGYPLKKLVALVKKK